MIRTLFASVLFLLAGLVPASALTVTMNDGGFYNLEPGTVFNFTESTNATPGVVTFGLDGSGFVDAAAAALIFDPLSPDFFRATKLQMLWSSAANGGGTIFADTGWVTLPGGVGSVFLGTNFAGQPVQWLTAMFDGIEGAGLVNLQVTGVTPVPVPAALPLLVTAVAGLVAFKRRRTAA